MGHHINSAMDAEVAESTAKSLRLATISSTKNLELFERFSAVLVAEEGTLLEDAVAEALQLYVERHPVQ